MPTVALYAPLGPGDASLILYSSALLVSLCLQSFPASLHRPHHSRATRTSCLGIAPTSASNCVLCDAKRTVAWGPVGRSPQRRVRASHCWRAACPPRAGYSQWQPCAARASHAPSHPQAGAVCALTRVASPVPRRSHSIRLTCDLFLALFRFTPTSTWLVVFRPHVRMEPHGPRSRRTLLDSRRTVGHHCLRSLGPCVGYVDAHTHTLHASTRMYLRARIDIIAAWNEFLFALYVYL